MENLLFLGVPILKHIRVCDTYSHIETCSIKLFPSFRTSSVL